MWCLGSRRCITPKYSFRGKTSSHFSQEWMLIKHVNLAASQIRLPQCWNLAWSILPGQSGVLWTTGNKQLFYQDFRPETVGQRNIRVLCHHGSSNGEDARSEWNTAARGRWRNFYLSDPESFCMEFSLLLSIFLLNFVFLKKWRKKTKQLKRSHAWHWQTGHPSSILTFLSLHAPETGLYQSLNSHHSNSC